MKKLLCSILAMAVLMSAVFTAVPVFAGSSYVMKVSANDTSVNYSKFEDGWTNAIELSKKYDTTVTLLSDWYAGDVNSNGVIDSNETAGSFKTYKGGAETGTSNGSLYIADASCNLIVDLNGYTISRNLENAVANGGVFVIDAGKLTVIDNSEAKTGKVTGGNNLDGGGAFCVNNGNLHVENIEISGNKTAKYGGGIYWRSATELCVIGCTITDNEAGINGGGIAVTDNSNVYIGGKLVITNNIRTDGTVDNIGCLFRGSDLKQAMAQSANIPYAPLEEGSCIGIHTPYDNDQISTFNSMFSIDSFEYFTADDSNYYIRAYYEAADEGNICQIYHTKRGTSGITAPGIERVAVKDQNLLRDATIDLENQVITLTAVNTKKDAFKYVSLSSLVKFDLYKDVNALVGRDDICNLLTPRKYRIMGNDYTYIFCTVIVEPEGGEWAENQEEVSHDYVMTVDDGERFQAFADFGEGWVSAIKLSQKHKTTVTLLSDWIAPESKFYYEYDGDEYGTYDGRLHLDNEYIDIIIDLNGHTISRNLSSAVSDGQVFRIEDGSLTIKDTSTTQSGKITGGNNNGNGGAFYVDDGSLFIESGTITGNKCTGRGGAIYWNSYDTLCLTGGTITGNRAGEEGGGIYVRNYGTAYIGDTAVVTDNTSDLQKRSNLYLSSDSVELNHAMGQAANIPYAPLKYGAKIGIQSPKANDLITDDNSKFLADSFIYLYADDANNFIRSIYDPNGGNNAYKLYHTSWANEEARMPRITSVTVANSDILESAELNYNTQVITLYAYKHKKASFSNISLDNLISCKFNEQGAYVADSNKAVEITSGMTYRIVSNNETYVMCEVFIEWVDCKHIDKDGNHVCDSCGEYILTEFAIVSYDAETKTAGVIVPEAGEYTLVFADYEGGKSDKTDIVKFKFEEGFNTVPQEISDFALESGDKVMLWYDTIDCEPVCNAFIIN